MERERSSTNSIFKKTLQTAEEESKTKKQKKVPFSEEDSAVLLERYDASIVLTLLQEVASHAHWKINWNELVEKTSTGISSAREYQMLWRHLAYGHPLIDDDFEDDAPPLDDDSDIECEREALPPANNQTALQAAACVQVMIASGSLSQCTPTSSLIEAPMTINVPVCGSSSNLMEESDIIFPVTVQRETRLNINVSSTRAIRTNGSVSGNTSIRTNGLVSGNTSNKKKRKGWSEEEDKELLAAVKKWGEGNWTNMVGRIPIERSASQLSKRWGILRKRGGGTN